MGNLKLSVSKKRNDRTAIPNLFIDQYMRDANGDFVKVYLYLLRSANSDDPDVSVSTIADVLNLTEKDVIRALKYWVKEGVMDVAFDEATKEPVSIRFLLLEAESAQAAGPDVAETSDSSVKAEHAAKEQAASAKEQAAPAKEAKPSISKARLAELRNQEEISDLFYVVEAYIGHTLNTSDASTILYIYDTLGFSSDLIDYLVQYCVTNEKTSFRYMEAVAKAWADHDIHTVEEAKDFAKMRNKHVTTVMKAFGISDRSLSPVEMDFVNRWYGEYAFPEDVVEEALHRTIMHIGKPTFSYAEKILKGWHDEQVHTLDDVKKLDDHFKAAHNTVAADTTVTAATGNHRTPAKPANKFNNFSQRTYNFDEMEKNFVNRP